MKNLLGIYEKALGNDLNWHDRLFCAKELGFDFVEISIDESDERLNRLLWTPKEQYALRHEIEKTGVPILSMCFSGHRRFPLGSHDKAIRDKALLLMQQTLDLAQQTGIRVIQLAGYDVYYEESNDCTKSFFLENLSICVQMAARQQIMLAIEIMDTNYINSITKYLWFDKQINSPWLAVYPDLGNLSAWGNDVAAELKKGIHKIVGIHVKETLAVTDSFEGKFKEVPFGSGCVDFVLCFNTLHKLQYSGPFMIEMWTGKDRNYKKEVDEARKFVIEKMRQGGYMHD